MTDDSKLTSETYVRIYDDKDGNYWQAGPDRDSLGLCELAYYEGGDAKPLNSFVIPWQAAMLLAQGITTCFNENMP